MNTTKGVHPDMSRGKRGRGLEHVTLLPHRTAEADLKNNDQLKQDLTCLLYITLLPQHFISKTSTSSKNAFARICGCVEEKKE